MRFGGPAVCYEEPDLESDKAALKSQVAALQSELEATNRRLSEIETDANTT